MAEDLEKVVRRAFLESGLSIKRLAVRSDVSYAACHRFATRGADVRISTLTRFAEVLGLELVARPRKRKRRA